MSTSAPSPVWTRWSRDLLFHLAGCVTATFGLVLWCTLVPLSLGLAITFFGLVVAVASLLACRWFARVERRRAAIVLGAPIAERYAPAPDARWTARLRALLGDATTWRDFAWTGLAGVVALPLSGLAVTLWGLVAGFVTLPAWYWTLPDAADVGVWEIGSLPRALAVAVVGVILVPVTGYLVRGLTIVEVEIMRWILTPRRDDTPADEGAPAVPGDATPGRVLALPLSLHVSFALLICTVVGIIWIATGFGHYFWPIWVWLPLGLTVAIGVVVVRAQEAPPSQTRALRAHGEFWVAISAFLVSIWLVAGAGTFWPFFAILSFAIIWAVHAIFALRDRLPLGAREQQLAERVDVLTRTRRGALDVQAAELRRIERDLHDGAQARLVSLTMQLGRAEERVADQPELAALLRGAREDAGLAIAELRDLARGIAPPILADRGLAAAIEALGRRSAIPVTVDADPDQRPLPVVETAAYFVVAEALTNVAKHAGGAAARVRVLRAGDDLVVEIADDGPGGANPAGGGLTGLRHRVEALDGTLTVTSPPGGGTTIRAELPCGP
ncbi:MAG TPA: sensor domain-containing protein [Solirubrobacteraceae bacterium]|nr:sensor domain-containing protein [Solirubrobacteraceae bacterium]